MKEQLIDKDKLLTYLSGSYNKAIANLNKAKELNIDYVMNVTIKNFCEVIAERIEKRFFDIDVEEKE